MKRETLDRFIGKEVTIKFTDGEIAKGRLERDPYNAKRYELVRQIECNIDFSPYLVKSIGSAKIYDKEAENE